MGHCGCDDVVVIDGYNTSSIGYCNNRRRNTNIVYNGDKLKVNSNIDSGSLILGLAAAAVGAYVGIKLYQKYGSK